MKDQYINSILKKIDKVRNDNTITLAANMLVEAIENKKTLYAFGASHAGILTEEAVYRAGGLALINPIFDKNLMLDVRPITKTSAIESMVDYGTIIANHVDFKDGDVLIAHSVSGRNPVMVDFVLQAKDKGVKIIAITNLNYSKSVESKHRSRKRLFELADLILDNHGDIGDATVSIDGVAQKIAPTSTVIGATIMNCLISEVARILKDKNMDIPIFYSANLDGTKEANNAIFEKYKDRIKYM